MANEPLDQATILRNLAEAKRNKSGNRVTSDTIRNKVTSFLNNDNLQFEAVEGLYPSGTKHSAIVARFRTVIMESKLDSTVYPIVAEDHVYLVKLVAA
jgi:hypothetical protein